MTSGERSSEEQPIVAPPHRVSIGRGGRGNMSASLVFPRHNFRMDPTVIRMSSLCQCTDIPTVAPEEIKYELKKASSTDEYDGMLPPSLILLFVPGRRVTLETGNLADDETALAEHNRRRSSSSWSLHSSSSGGTSKTDALKDFFRRGSQSKRKSLSQDGIAEGEEAEEDGEREVKV